MQKIIRNYNKFKHQSFLYKKLSLVIKKPTLSRHYTPIQNNLQKIIFQPKKSCKHRSYALTKTVLLISQNNYCCQFFFFFFCIVQAKKEPLDKNFIYSCLRQEQHSHFGNLQQKNEYYFNNKHHSLNVNPPQQTHLSDYQLLSIYGQNTNQDKLQRKIIG